MAVWIYSIFLMILSVRVLETYLSKRNEHWLEERGAVEKEKRKYRWMHMLQRLFFLSVLAECLLLIKPEKFNVLFLSLFVLLTAGKLWCMITLGRFWTLKHLKLPGVLLFRRGSYRLVKEPYNVITLVQLFIVPLLFGAYITALIFPVTYLFMMQVKLPERGSLFTKAPL